MKSIKPVKLHAAPRGSRLPSSFIGKKLLSAAEWDRISLWVRSRLGQKVDDILVHARKEKPIPTKLLSSEVIREAMVVATRMPKHVDAEQLVFFGEK